MEARLIPPLGLASRPATIDDVDTVTRLVAACEHHDDGDVEVDRDDVVSDLSLPSLDLERDTVVILHGQELVACAQVHRAGAAVYADVHPDHRGRGIGSALLAWSEDRTREIGGAFVRQTKTDANRGAADLFGSNGYEPVWTSWLLEIRMGEEGPPSRPPPEGIRIRDFVPGQDDRAVHRLIDDAFNEWERHESTPFEAWAAAMIRRDTFDPQLSPLAVAGDEIVGAALSLDYGEDVEGWVQQVAVQKPYRNRGIASALLNRAFREFHRKGRRVCTLSTDSRTGALALYQRVGMGIRRSYTAYAKDLAPAARRIDA